jgi:hypothetical protein
LVAFKGRAGALWRAVTGGYELDPAERALLTEACHTLAELERIDAELSAGPLMVAGSKGQPAPNPLIAAAQTHRKTLEQLLRALALPVPGEKVGAVRHPAQRRAAKVKGLRRGEVG